MHDASLIQLPPEAAAVCDWLRARGAGGLSLDSRRLAPGEAFIAWPGAAHDARRFVPQALAAGAPAALVDAEGLDPWWAEWGAAVDGQRVAAVPGLKALAGPLAAQWHGQPSEKLSVLAVTGTNGKTSTTWWLAQALTALGRPCAVAGTLGLGLPPAAHTRAADGQVPLAGWQPSGLTTPDPLTWQAQLRRWADAGVAACAVEASSIGLAEHRLDGTRVAVAVFTNLTQDHLDYHGSMQAYWAAKARLFRWPGLGAAVLNVDDAHGAALARELAEEQAAPVCGEAPALWTTSLAEDAGASSAWVARLAGGGRGGRGGHVQASGWRTTASGLAFEVRAWTAAGCERAAASLPAVGRYNVANALGVLAALCAQGFSLAQSAGACSALTAVPGRLQPVHGQAEGGVAEPLVLVDYAHTPDALAQVLAALRPLARERGGRLITVVGCGGNRDAGKRPLMAAAAEARSDALWLTSDNPRDEDPLAILAQMHAGLSYPGAAHTEPDRAQAIAQAVAQAGVADVVLIAGKGHESTQEIAGVKHPFSDAAHAQRALRARGDGCRCRAPVSHSTSRPMSDFTLTELLPRLPGARAVGRCTQPALRVHTDSRSVQPGDLFVALRGERFDGHDFLAQAAQAGAVAAVAERGLAQAGLPGVQVPDSTRALGDLAQAWRAQFQLPLIAVTGSNGKTTTTQMLAAILRAAVGGDGEEALATRGNLNNHIGLPQTLLRLTRRHRLAVVELGMNHPGEIARLAEIAQPTVALVNNAQREHQEFMRSVEAVARENGQVIVALPPEGTAVFPSDEAHTPLWRELAGHRAVLTFSDRDPAADVRGHATWTGLGWELRLHTPQGEMHTRLRVAGRHNVRNALAAAACALAAGVPLAAVAEGLRQFEPVQGRSRVLALQQPGGVLTVVDDTYNANPDSVLAALEVLASLPAPRLAVLGDMGEVGSQALAFHTEVLQRAADLGLEAVWTTGAHMGEAVAHGAWADVHHVADMAELLPHVRTQARAPGSVLVKGSRFMQMERVVHDLQATWPPAPAATNEEAAHAA